jgi:asparagine synthase (glutamine-hydrolysing)
MRSDVEVGICLSGGLDSSSILALLKSKINLEHQIQTFSAVFPGTLADESDFIKLNDDDKIISNFIHCNDESLFDDLDELLNCHQEPFPSPSPYAQFKVMQAMKGNVKVVLDGQGADEFLLGYDYFWGIYFKELLFSGRILTLLSEMYCQVKRSKSFFCLWYFIYYLSPLYVKRFIAHHKVGYVKRSFTKVYSKKSRIARVFYGVSKLSRSSIQHYYFKLEHLLKWEDRNSMWHSIEARVPFLDHRLVELSVKLDNKFKMQKGVTKVILRNCMRGKVHDKIIDRVDKNGFDTPSALWFKSKKWQVFIKEIMDSDSFRSRIWWDAEKCSDMYQEYLLNPKGNPNEIWKCIILELWMRKFNVQS